MCPGLLQDEGSPLAPLVRLGSVLDSLPNPWQLITGGITGMMVLAAYGVVAGTMTVGDFVLARKDGAASYQLATVLDDAHQGVTEVLRGDDLLPSAARQTLLAEALDLPLPSQAHLPLVVDAHGQRLAKRDGAVTLQELRRGGLSPERICRWAARSAGFTETEHDRPAKFWTQQSMMLGTEGGPIRLPESPLDDL